MNKDVVMGVILLASLILMGFGLISIFGWGVGCLSMSAMLFALLLLGGS